MYATKSFCINWKFFVLMKNYYQIEISFNKCMYIHFGTSVFEFWYSFGNYVIKKCQNVIDLSISISHDLKFSLHYENIAVKASRRAALILKCFNNKKCKHVNESTCAFVRPLLKYGSCIWNFHLTMDLKLKERAQCTFTRQLFLRARLPMLSYA